MIKSKRVLERILNKGRSAFLNTCFEGTGCCHPSCDSLKSARFDIERKGLRICNNIKECDLLVISGYINHKYAEKIIEMYESMNAPKRVMAVGNCACAGGIFSESEEIIKGLSTIIPVDVFVPGCPPRPEAIFNGAIKLMEMIKRS